MTLTMTQLAIGGFVLLFIGFMFGFLIATVMAAGSRADDGMGLD